MSYQRGKKVVAGAALIAALAAPGVGAESLPTGRLIDNVEVEADRRFSYTLYLPAGYSEDRDWPLLFIMDPRGRGRLAAQIFADGAERYGFILASSNDTRSDGPLLPNEQAINATLPELAQRFSIRPGDLYLAGMSGTSRVAWMAGHLMSGTVGGVIGSAAATAGGDLGPGPETRFAWFGIAANRDYNYREMLEADAALKAAGATRRLAYVDGPHSWPPPEVAARALGWMRLVSFRSGRREMAPGLIDGLLASMRAAAAEHESAGRELDALLTYRGIVEDFSAVRPTDADSTAISRLESSPTAEQQRSQRRLWSRRETAYPTRIGDATARLKTRTPPPRTDQLLDELDVAKLLATARESPGSEAGLAAGRMLSTLFSQMSFYVFRLLHAGEQWDRAEIGLEVADTVAPGNAGVLYNLACVRARSGKRKRALEALEDAVTAGFADLAAMERDPDLSGLRETAGYRRIAARLAASVGGEASASGGGRR